MISMQKPDLQLEQFSGPLDLLLGLLQDQKFSISDLALSKITEQYLNYLDNLEENKAEELADFLVVGARLLFLKSKALLPQFSPEEDEGEQTLEAQLRIYKIFVDASKILNKNWLSLERSVFRIEPPQKLMEFALPVNLSPNSLRESMVQLVHRLEPPKPLPETRIDRTVSMKEKIDFIRQMLIKQSSFIFHKTLTNARNKTEVIVGFLALLELVKQKSIYLRQDETFSDIVIERV